MNRDTIRPSWRPAVQAEARLRAKHQMTLPDAVARTLRLEAGDRVVFEADVETGEVRLRRARPSYAGSLAALFSGTEANAAYLAGERAAWDDEKKT